MTRQESNRNICGECARFKIPDSGCYYYNDIRQGIMLRSDPACDRFYPANKSAKKDKEEHIPHKASGLAEEGYYEAVYHDGNPAFLVKSKENYSILETVTNDGKKLSPKEWPNEIPYDPYGVYESQVPNREDLFWKVRDEIDLFLDLDSIWKDFLTACVLLTYQQEKLRTVPYVYFVGDNESGKTVALTLLKWLCYRPLLGVTIPSADIYGYLDDADAPGTILEDEAQGLWKDMDKAKIYKAGYKQGAIAPRTFITQHKRFIKYFRIFCLKACAAEEMPRVKGLLERFIFIPMVEGYPKKDWADLDKEDEKRLRELRNILLKWRLQTREWDLPDIDLPAKGRLKELWKPIIQIVQGLTVEKDLRAHLERLQQERLNEKTNTLEGRLVKVVAELYESDKILPFTNIWNRLVEQLEATQNDKTPNMADSAEFGIITKRQVGYRLREVLNGRKRSIRTAIGFTKGYDFNHEQICRIARKYGVNIVSKCLINPTTTPIQAQEDIATIHQNNIESIEKTVEVDGSIPSGIGHIRHKDTEQTYSNSKAIANFKAVYWSDNFYGWHECAVCGCNKLTSWQAETFQDEKLWLCDDCKENWEKQQEVVQ